MILLAELAARAEPMLAELAARAEPMLAELAARVEPMLAELAARVEPMLAELAVRAEPLVSVEDIGHCIECEEAISRDIMREMGMFVVDSLYDIWSLKRLWFWLQQQ